MLCCSSHRRCSKMFLAAVTTSTSDSGHISLVVIHERMFNRRRSRHHHRHRVIIVCIDYQTLTVSKPPGYGLISISTSLRRALSRPASKNVRHDEITMLQLLLIHISNIFHICVWRQLAQPLVWRTTGHPPGDDLLTQWPYKLKLIISN